MIVVLHEELQFCKEYDVKSGYKYTDFFHIESLKRNRNSIDKDEESMVNVKLFVLATKDAHILLSPTEKIKSSPIYEIGIERFSYFQFSNNEHLL